jgi:ribose transport system permease protein
MSAEVVGTRQEPRRRGLASLAEAVLFSARFLTIWLATLVLLVVCKVIAPGTLTKVSFSAMLPLISVIAVAALGQLLVVVTGGIDLSVPGVISLMANVVVGQSDNSNDKLFKAIVVVIVVSAVIGLINGCLVAVVKLNPLIVTLAVGIVLGGVTARYRFGPVSADGAPPALVDLVIKRPLGVSWLFWSGLIVTVLLATFLRSTIIGRRFQAVGANPEAAWIAGLAVRRNVVAAYMASSIAAGLAAIMLAAVIRSPGVDPGKPYLFAPVAAVLLAGTALDGGLFSVTSVWVSAFFFGLLNQMLKVMGLSSAIQYIVFGGAIVLGMVVTGDRIAAVMARLLQRPRVRAMIGAQAFHDTD